ncbi:hypothetical protein [Dysgonomonas sp.]
MLIRLCLYVEGKNIADITGIWMFNDPPELNRIIELACYYANGGFFSPRQEFFVLKSRLDDRIFHYLFFELKWIIRSIKEIKEGGKPKFVIILDSLEKDNSPMTYY